MHFISLGVNEPYFMHVDPAQIFFEKFKDHSHAAKAKTKILIDVCRLFFDLFDHVVQSFAFAPTFTWCE